MRHVIADSRRWSPGMAERLRERTGDEFVTVSDPAEFTRDLLVALTPGRVFLPHWSYLLPPEIHENFDCIVFHMTDLPFGRGGSPLQNLVARGIYETSICALRCEREPDSGPVYLRRPLSLHGAAQEIYMRAARVIEDMIVEILQTAPQPVPQQGEPVVFRRRTPEDGDISGLADERKVFDWIRMLDAPGYPPAFADVGAWRLEFSRAALEADSVVAQVRIRRRDS